MHTPSTEERSEAEQKKACKCLPEKKNKVKLSYFKDKTDRWLQAAYISGNIGAGLVMPVFVYIFAQWASSLSGQTSRKWQFWVSIMVVVAISDFFFVAIGTGCAEYSAERQLRKVRLQFLREMMRQDVFYFDQQDAANLASEMNSNCAVFREARGMRNGLVFMYWGLTVGCIGISLYLGAIMTLVCTCTLPIIVAAGWWAMKIELKAHADANASLGEASSVAQESLAAIRTVKAFSLEETMRTRFDQAVKQAFETACIGANKSAIGFGIYWGLIFMSSAFGFWFGAKQIAYSLDRPQGGCTALSQAPGCFNAANATGIFVNVVMAAYFVGKIIPMFTVRGKAHHAMDQIVDILVRPSTMNPYSDEGLQPSSLRGDIELKNLRFCYPSRPDLPVFSDLNLKIKAGSTAALVGGSGCGKSTLVQLLERFYDPSDGDITLDGYSLRDYNLRWLRDNMALVSQEPKLFASTIAENIQVGRESATRDEIVAAAKEANAHEFIRQLPKGYDTWVGEAGGQLSGGQKQRIAIARAILRQPRILILDEATSALDNESEKLVQETLDRVVSGSKRTTIVIAHRLTTIRNADSIIVLDNSSGTGAVVAEQGTHDELMQIENGLYNALVCSQTTGDDYEAQDALAASMSLASQYSRDLSKRQMSLVSLHSKFSAVAEDAGRGHSIFRRSDSPRRPRQRVFRRVMAPAKRNIPTLLLGCLGSLINGAIWPLFALAFASFMESYTLMTGTAIVHSASKWALVMVGIGVANFFGFWLQNAYMGRLGLVNARELRREAYKRTLHQEVAFFDYPERNSGALVQLLISDASLVAGWTGTNLGLILAGASCLLVGIACAMSAAPKLGLLALAGLCVMIPASYFASVLTATGGKFRRATAPAESEDEQRPAHVLNEVILNIRTVYAYNLQRQMNQRFSEMTEAEFHRGRRRALVAGLTNGLANCLRLFIFTGIFYYGGKKTAEEKMDPKAMMQGSLCILIAAMQLGRTFVSSTSPGRSRECTTNVLEIIDRRPAIDDIGTSGDTLHRIDGIDFENIAFRYPTRPQLPIYRDVSFRIPRGKVVALVGASGCGKSTAVQLLERFYDVTESESSAGRIAINGKDLRDFNVQSLRSRIGLVSQEPCLFWGSVEENIFFGNPNASLDDLRRACQMANAWDFIQALPEGLHTDVGRGGSRLSGGQKQRVAIARALLRHPELLILDEATSALDNESERVVQEALSALLADKAYTTVIIAHRLSTIRKADAIVVFVNTGVQGSRVAEVGTHDELMKRPKGIYRNLVRIANAG